MVKALVSFLITHRKKGVGAMAVITLFFLSQIFRIQMFTQFLDLFPQNHPYVQVHQQYAKYFGGAYQATLVLEVKKGDVFNTETLAKMSRITDAVDLIPGVDHFGIFSIASQKVSILKETAGGFSSYPVMKEVPKDQSTMEELKKKVFTSGNVNGIWVSRDQKALRLDANFIEGKIDFNVLYNKFMEIKKKEQDGNHKIYLTGTPLLYGWIYHYLPNMALILAVTSVVILLMLFAYMSRGGLWFWPFISAVITSIWGLGFAAILKFHFDPLIIVIPFLLSARAMSHGVQWVERFTEEYQKSGDTREAALITGTSLFPPGLIGILADTLALLVICLTPIPTLRNLAYLGFFWSGAMIFTIFFLYPPLFALFTKVRVPKESDVPASLAHKQENFTRRVTTQTTILDRSFTYRIEYFTEHLLRRILIRMSNWTFGAGRYATVGLSILILIIAVISSTHLKFGDANPGSPILWPYSEFNQDVIEINRKFPGVDQMWVAVQGKGPQSVTYPDVIQGMEGLRQYMMADPNVGFAISVADLIKGANMLAYGNDPKMESIPTSQQATQNMITLIQTGAAPGEMDTWIDYGNTSTNVKLFLKNHEGPILKEVIHRVKDFIKNNPKLMENAVPKPAGGLGGILAAANEVIQVKKDQILFIVLSIIFILCAVTYRSILAGIIFIMSLILANFLAFTYMVFKNIGLNINTFPVVSLGIGLGVDYGLYIVSRIIEVYREERDLAKAVRGGIITSGRAVFFTATMMTAGVIFWFFSPLRFQAEMGILLGILMMVNMLVGVLVLPAVINIIKPKFITRGGDDNNGGYHIPPGTLPKR
ncbi:MAG: MMPL family transporter [Deltaproteobacteria bacterium]|nr:MMPL family transporter [Deltaproteobacteria bacterium]